MINRLLVQRSHGRAGGGGARRLLPLLGLLALLLGLVPLFANSTTAAASDLVYVARISGPIDLGQAPYLARAVREAEGAGARALVIAIDTPGGRLDAALQLRATLLNAQVPTIAFIDREAFSAGALLALASGEIYMAPGAVFGAATPVTGNGVQADEKTVSAVRATFKTTAETRGRDPLIAQAMVDPAVAVEGFPVGRLITLTSAEAEARGFVDGVVADRAALLRAAGLADATVREVGISPAERLLRGLTDPTIGALLFALGALLIIGSLFAGELGVFTGLGVGALALFFWGHTLAGLAGWEGIALAALGLLLIAVEVFILPGFGIAGVLGGVSLLAALAVSVTDGDLPTPDAAERALTSAAIAAVALVVGGGLALRFLPGGARRRGLILQAAAGGPSWGDDGEAAPSAVRRAGVWRFAQALTGEAARGEQRLASERRTTLEGARGVALADLRPGGFAQIDGARVDVITRGEVIPAGTPVVIIQDEGYRRIVRRVAPDEPENATL